MIAGPTVPQLVRKKAAEKPSGPGALSGWIEKRASLISLGVGMLARVSLSSAETVADRASSTMADTTDPEEVKSLEK